MASRRADAEARGEDLSLRHMVQVLDGGAGFEVVGPTQAALAAMSAASRTIAAPRVTS